MGVLVITSTRQDLKTKGIIFRIKMKGLQILCLVGLSIASQQKLDSANAKMVNEMMDAVESGLETPGDGEARALFLTVTLTSTSTNLATATVTSTVTNTCAAVTYTGTCTTPTTTAAPRNARDIVKYYLDGSEVPIHEIMPSTVDESRSDLDALNADLIMDADAPSVMSGSMSWSDVLVKKTPSACGRDAHDNHRRQVIALANENVALNLTTT